MAIVEFVALVVFSGGLLLVRFALLFGYAGPAIGSTPESTAALAVLRRRAPFLASLGLLLVGTALVIGLASGGDPLVLVATGGSLVLLLLGPPLLLGRWWARRVSTKRAVYGSALLFAVPFLGLGLAQVGSGRLDIGGFSMWIVLAAIFFIVYAVGADLILRAFEGDRPIGDEPPVEPPGAEAGRTR